MSLLDPDVALATVLAAAPEPRAEACPLQHAVGRVLVAPVRARVPQPPFSKAMMDGYAVRAQDAGETVTLVGEVPAGRAPDRTVAPGEAIAVMTGAPCPPGADAVVKVEDAPRQGDRVSLPPQITAGQHIQPEGHLCAAGDEVLPAGTLLTTVAIASAAAVGVAAVQVAARPRIALVTTGDEVARPGEALAPAQIYDSNGPMLEALARGAGAGSVRRLHAGDTAESLAAALAAARAGGAEAGGAESGSANAGSVEAAGAESWGADVVVLSGGVSMGRYDLVPAALAQAGYEQVFHKVRQRPGKPILFARGGQTLVFGLPGTPLGSHLGFHRYVAAAIRKMLGRAVDRPRHAGVLLGPLRSHGARTLFRLVRAERCAGGWQVDPLPWGGSSDLVGPARANAYLRLEPGHHDLPAGARVEFELVDGATEDVVPGRAALATSGTAPS